MTEEDSLFILGGNGSYNNRGCEAIVRGTTNIIRNYYKNSSFLCLTQYTESELNDEQYIKQSTHEIDNNIIHKKTLPYTRKFFAEWICNKFLFKKQAKKGFFEYLYKELIPDIPTCKAVLSVGGDNYAADFGFPRMVTNLDDIVLKRRKPLIIWGASVGPFDKMPKCERYMADHLPKVTAIFARESVTVDYLSKIGVKDNVFKVADPAFLMEATEPNIPINPVINEGSIGINLSPLMAKYVTKGDIEEWKKRSAEIISSISRFTSSNIYLIPHVTTPDSSDYIFMKDVLSRISEPKENIILIPPIYNASETKWIISKMQIFAGSRTHSTIAALSSMVPTLSFAYSIKARGINRDIFGNNEYCLNAEEMNSIEVTGRIEEMLTNYKKIKNELNTNIPICEKKALLAGKYLREILGP